MSSGKKVGRKRRVFRTDEKLIMHEFSIELDKLLSKSGRSMGEIAEKLQIGRASLYKYRRELALPPFEVLRSASRFYGFKFSHIDFEEVPLRQKRRGKRSTEPAVLPLLALIEKDDIEVVRTKPVASENALELTIHIRFGS